MSREAVLTKDDRENTGILMGYLLMCLPRHLPAFEFEGSRLGKYLGNFVKYFELVILSHNAYLLTFFLHSGSVRVNAQ